jgi:ribosomal protein L22
VQQQQKAEASGGEPTKTGATVRDPNNMAFVLDPDPNARERWERKKVIQMIRKGGRLSKQQVIKRTEREHQAKSHNFKTSVKKLGMLARQIAGKTIDNAIVQMRFSKKRVAQEVLKHLEHARDEAVVMRGMGLGAVETSEEAPNFNKSSADISGTLTVANEDDKPSNTPLQIQLRSGKRHTVSDKSQIYIDQAWVGRGPFGKLPDFRARGRVFLMRTPWTSLTVVLKEEATRVREHQEREEKRRKQLLDNVWTHLPDRPVQWQRQWYTF